VPWFVFVNIVHASNDERRSFDSLADATLYAIDLADLLGQKAGDGVRRSVDIVRQDGQLSLSISIVPGGLTSEAAPE